VHPSYQCCEATTQPLLQPWHCPAEVLVRGTQPGPETSTSHLLGMPRLPGIVLEPWGDKEEEIQIPSSRVGGDKFNRVLGHVGQQSHRLLLGIMLGSARSMKSFLGLKASPFCLKSVAFFFCGTLMLWLSPTTCRWLFLSLYS